VVDLSEDLLTVADRFSIVFWPLVIDTRYDDVEKMTDGEITVTLLNGAVRMDEQERMARLLRRKSRYIVAYGSCAHLGGVYGLANLFNRQSLLAAAYHDSATTENPSKIVPGESNTRRSDDLELPVFYDTVRPLNQIMDVDFTVPGCPPTPELVHQCLTAIADNRLPPKGSVFAEAKALCDICPRKESKPEKVTIGLFRRLFEEGWNDQQCFLNHGVICLGPSTRGGCRARCIEAGMPCRGCFGPMELVIDHGAKSLAFLAALMDTNDEEKMQQAVDSIPDLAGLLYRFSLPSSILRGKIQG
jgi:F420-non-reducing hydrogenase small subunit